MADIKKLLVVKRAQRNKRPHFKREGFGTRKRIALEWKKPRGRHSKMKHNFAGRRRCVASGFRCNKLVRFLDMSGLKPIIICTPKHVPLLNKEIHGAIISSSVGVKKKLKLIEELKKHGIKILNLKETHVKKMQESLSVRKKLKEEKQKQKESKSKKETKKVEKKEKELTQEEKEIQERKEKEKILTKAQK